MLVSSVARSTVDSSSSPDWTVPAPPLPALPSTMAPDCPLVWYTLPLSCVSVSGETTVATGIL